MFRCKVCGWIHEGAAPPDACPSCGSPADRFRAMDMTEIGEATRDLANYGVAGQGYERIVFPGCLGRICAAPCEEACRRKEVDAPIAIRMLKRVAADYRGETRRQS